MRCDTFEALTRRAGLLVSYRPLACKLEAEAVSQLRKLYLSYKLPFFWETAREMKSSSIQSALTYLRAWVRSAEKPP